MRLLRGLTVLVLFAVLAGCSGNSKAVMDNYRKNYSVEVEGITETAISDGLPSDINLNSVSKTILNGVVNALSNEGLTKNDNKNKYRVKYNISYFGHKWMGLIRVKYIMRYNIQLIDENAGIVIASEKNDKDNIELGKVIDDVADDIASFALNKIK